MSVTIILYTTSESANHWDDFLSSKWVLPKEMFPFYIGRSFNGIYALLFIILWHTEINTVNKKRDRFGVGSEIHDLWIWCKITLYKEWGFAIRVAKCYEGYVDHCTFIHFEFVACLIYQVSVYRNILDGRNL